MLLGIDPLLGPDCLATLRAMGHGDCLVLADANYPASSSAQRLIRMDGASALQALAAVLSVLPVDDFDPRPLVSMQVVGNPEQVPPIVREMQALVDRVVPAAPRIASLERFAFYALAKTAYAVIATGERAFYANLIIRKGVVPPPGVS
ncbi:MAG TPA: RbsD/FucU domain-containing protein, partial [Polyangiaceae bacterium]|nr:RbsD/FucU domain-containing protein [Polyangiaceae bacterium]